MDLLPLRCLEDRHQGATAYVLYPGLGTALLSAEQLGPGPVIAIEEAARELVRLHQAQQAYVLQVDSPVFPSPELAKATLVTIPRLARHRPGCNVAMLFESGEDLQGKRPCRLLPDARAELMAVELARLMGCAELVLIGFDAWLAAAAGFCRYDLPHAAPVDRLRCEALKLQLRGLPARFYSAVAERFLPVASAELTVITATGDRPLTLAMGRWWLLRQSLLPAQWIIVDDGREPLPPGLRFAADYVYRQPEPHESGQTLTKNLLAVLSRVRYPKIAFLEDDDWYHADYLRAMNRVLDLYDLVGQGEAVYYHYPTAMWYRHPNLRHASLAQTAFTAEVLPLFTEICQQAENAFVDLPLWKRLPAKRRVLPGSPPLSIGMKGLPGRRGLGFGHVPDGKFLPDVGGQFLRRQIGDDCAIYEACLGPRRTHLVAEAPRPAARTH
jgi:hypothetical protein